MAKACKEVPFSSSWQLWALKPHSTLNSFVRKSRNIYISRYDLFDIGYIKINLNKMEKKYTLGPRYWERKCQAILGHRAYLCSTII